MVNSSGTGPHPPLRSDAVRNVERIVQAAREVFVDSGPRAPLEEIARRAGVGTATLFRRFPDRAQLVRAALDAAFADQVTPALQAAGEDPDPYRGFVLVIEAVVTASDRERSLLTAGHEAGVLGQRSTDMLNEHLVTLAGQAQAAGRIRSDLDLADVPRLVVMVVSVLLTSPPADPAWRRCLSFLLDGLSVQGSPPSALDSCSGLPLESAAPNGQLKSC